MKHIHIYNNRAEYNAADKNEYDMSLIRDEDNYVELHKDYSKEYLTLEITKSGVFTILAALDKKGTTLEITEETALTLSYSINNGTWISSKITSDGVTFDVLKGDKIRFKGTNTNYCCNDSQFRYPHKEGHITLGCRSDFGDEYKNNYTWSTAEFIAYGNIMSLCYGNNFIGQTTLPATFTFCSLFKTSGIVSAKNLVLPAITLVENCYRALFAKCWLLKEGPLLQVKNLVAGCYAFMFESCKSLTKIVCLAETGMTTEDDTGSLKGFMGSSNNISVNKYGTFIKSKNAACWVRDTSGILTTWTIKNYEGYFYDIEEDDHDYSQDYLTFDVVVGGTIGWYAKGNQCIRTIQYSINNGEWISITAGAKVTISVLTGDKVRFKGTNIGYAKSNTQYSGFGLSSATSAYNVSGNIMSLIYGDDFIGNNELLSLQTFRDLFDGSNVVSAKNLILPATNLTYSCYRGMFANCIGLIAAPTLPATNLVKACYASIFYNCPVLSYVKCLANNDSIANNILSTDYTYDWLSLVAEKGTFVKNATTNNWLINNNGNNRTGIPIGWTIENYIEE